MPPSIDGFIAGITTARCSLCGRWRPAIHLVHRRPPGRYYPWMKVPSVSAGAFGEFAGRIGAITAGRPTDEVPGRGQEPGRCQVPRRS